MQIFLLIFSNAKFAVVQCSRYFESDKLILPFTHSVYPGPRVDYLHERIYKMFLLLSPLETEDAKIKLCSPYETGFDQCFFLTLLILFFP